MPYSRSQISQEILFLMQVAEDSRKKGIPGPMGWPTFFHWRNIKFGGFQEQKLSESVKNLKEKLTRFRRFNRKIFHIFQ